MIVFRMCALIVGTFVLFISWMFSTIAEFFCSISEFFLKISEKIIMNDNV